MPILVNFAAGQRVTAALLNEIQVASVTKATNQSVTSSTTLVNDTALFLPLLASASYDIKMIISYEGGTQAASDFKFQLNAPAGATGHSGPSSTGTPPATSTSRARRSGLRGPAWSRRRRAVSTLNCFGSVTTTGTAGNLQLQWAQHQQRHRDDRPLRVAAQPVQVRVTSQGERSK